MSLAARAADGQAASGATPFDFDATATFDVTSGYLLYGALMNSGPCAQGGAEAGVSHATFGRAGVGAWANSDLTDRRRAVFGKAFNEDDFYMHWGHAFDVARDVSVNLRAMHMWYWYPDDSGRTGKGCPSKKEIYLIGSIENRYMVPYAMFTHEYQLTDGSYIELGLRRRCAITDALSITPSFSANGLSHSYMTIFPAKETGRACGGGIGCLEAMLSAEYAVTEHVSLRARLAYISLVNDELRDAVDSAHGSTYRTDFVWGAIGLAVAF